MSSGVHTNPGRGWGAYHEKAEPEGMSLSEVLVQAWRQQQADSAERRQPFIDWALRLPEPKTGTLDFVKYPFQRELYQDGFDDKEIVVKKSTQIGVSAFLVRWTMYWADVAGKTAIYIFPKSKQLFDFSDTRIRPIIMSSEYLRERIPGSHVMNKSLKQIGLGFVYYRGSESVDDLESVDADAVALDEYDNLTQSNIPIVERRLSGVDSLGLLRRVGVPSIPEFGIAKLYGESDQRRWHVKCTACNEWQTINFHDNIDQTRLLRICRKCAKPIDVGTGEWVATYPDRAVRGYHVTRLIAPTASLEQMVKASKKRTPFEVQSFWNRDLGEEYAAEESRLNPQALAAAQREFTMVPGLVASGQTVTMGVDVASARALNVRISLLDTERTKRGLWIGTVDNFDELCNLMDRYSVNMAAIDAMPEHRLARAFAERFPGRVYIVHYAGAQSKDVLSVDETQRRVVVRRVEAIDAMIEGIRSQRNLLPLDLPEGYVSEMMSVVRKVERDELDKVVVSYISVGPDDYAHAETFDVIAGELWWMRQAVDEAQREVIQPLDSLMEFQRSTVAQNTDESDLYHAGPEEVDWDVSEEDR